MTRTKWLFGLAVVALLAGCTAHTFEERLVVQNEFNRNAYKGPYKTWDWAKYDTDQVIITDARVRERVMNAIEAALAARGINHTTESPDLMIGYFASTEQKLDETVLQTYYDEYSMDMDRNAKIDSWKVGTLGILAFDAKTGMMVWRGSAQAELDDKANETERNKRIEIAVKKILEEMPGGPTQK